MKKIFGFILVLVATLTLAACGSKDYKQDGTFRAFEVGDNYGVPMITWADVVIKNGKVESITLDALQGAKVEGENGFSFVWNEKSKKELGYGYRMHAPGMKDDEEYKQFLKDEKLLEWFEQAELIEAHFLANVGKKLSIDGLADVTIDDGGYSKVVQKALDNAKKNLFIDFETSLNYGQAQVTWAELTTNGKGKVTKVYLNAIQSANFVWNEKNKKELGYAYRMHAPGMADDEEYKQFLKDEGLLEWFEQAELIEKAYLANNNASLDGLAGVSIITTSYQAVVSGALKLIK